MYFTAHGRALPCCIAPFSVHGYDTYTLATPRRRRCARSGTARRYRDFARRLTRRRPARACARLRPAMEPLAPATPPELSEVTVVIPTLNEAEAIAGVIIELPREVVAEIIVADSGSRDGTQARARAAGAEVIVLWRTWLRPRLCCRRRRRGAVAPAIIVFIDGDGSDRGDLDPGTVAPDPAGTHDFVIASRTRGRARARQHELAPDTGRPPRRSRDAGCSTA